MGTDIYVVISGEKIPKTGGFPLAHLGTHFTGKGLTPLPENLPEGSMLLIDDRVIPKPSEVSQALAQLAPVFPRLSGIYLDFQRPETPLETAEKLAEKIPIPVGLPQRFSGNFTTVFPPRPLNLLQEHFLPQGKTIWMEAALTCWEVTVDGDGCRKKEIPRKENFSGFPYEKLFCSYKISTGEDKAVFTFQNTPEDLHREITSLWNAERVLVPLEDFSTGKEKDLRKNVK